MPLAARRSWNSPAAWALAAAVLLTAGMVVLWPAAASPAEGQVYQQALALLEKDQFDAAERLVRQAGTRRRYFGPAAQRRGRGDPPHSHTAGLGQYAAG